MRFASKSVRAHGLLLDMTPMIDIVFLLLIFFLTTAQMANESRAELDLPQERGEQRDEVERAGFIINVLADGSITEGGKSLSIDQLEKLALVHAGAGRTATGTPIRPLIRADRSAPAARLNDVFLAMQRAGLESARLATSPAR